jgi:hypothetical protein
MRIRAIRVVTALVIGLAGAAALVPAAAQAATTHPAPQECGFGQHCYI